MLSLSTSANLADPLRRWQVHVERTLKLALLLGQSAVDAKVGVYLRLLASQYKTDKDKKGKVGEPGAEHPSEPWGCRASWFHEAARGLAQIQGCALGDDLVPPPSEADFNRPWTD